MAPTTETEQTNAIQPQPAQDTPGTDTRAADAQTAPVTLEGEVDSPAAASAPTAIENTDAGISETSPEPPSQLKSLMIQVVGAGGKTGRAQAFKRLKQYNDRLDKLRQMVKCIG